MAIEQLSYSAAEIDGILSQVSGDNLLINPFFQINQRGQNSYSGAGYTVDGWYTNSNGSFVVDTKMLSASGGVGYLRQNIENALNRLKGHTVTYSAIIGSVLVQGTAVVPESPSSDVIETASFNGGNLAIRISVSSTSYFGITFLDGTTNSIKAAKLELGEISTLANDVPDPNEIDKCKRYFRLWKTADARTEALKEVGLMRLDSPTLGTINIGGTTYYTASAEL